MEQQASKQASRERVPRAPRAPRAVRQRVVDTSPGECALTDVVSEQASKQANLETLGKQASKQAEKEDPIEDELEEVLASEAGTMKFYGDKLHLTYKGHVDKDAMEKWVTESLKTGSAVRPAVKFFRVAHETGDKNHPYPHSHVLIEWEKKVRFQGVRTLDWPPGKEAVHPSWKPVKTDLHWKRSMRYLSKEDPANADLKNIKTHFTEEIAACKTVREALMCAQRPGDVSGVLACYETLHEETVDDKVWVFVEMLSYWQDQLAKIVWGRLKRATELREQLKSIREAHSALTERDDLTDEERWRLQDEIPSLEGLKEVSRVVIVIYDEHGNAGKSAFASAIQADAPDRVWVSAGVSNTRDMPTQVSAALDAGNTCETVICDLSRQAERHKIYASVEDLRNGCVTTQKWKGVTRRWRMTNLILMTNWMPDLAGISQDRWEIYSVNGRRSLLKKLTLEEASEIAKRDALRRDVEDPKGKWVLTEDGRKRWVV